MYSKVSLLLTTVLTVSLGAGQAIAQGEDVDVIEITGRYLSLDQLNSVKTPTPIIDVPQSLSIITDVQITEQGFVNFGDILRYTPGLSISQGEGHRDAINIRGNQSTADFFLNGIRDDVQYYRPLYNLEQVEILRGSNALLFGRGGGGGVVNRVTKTPVVGEAFHGFGAAIDTFGAGQLTADINLDTGDQSGVRLNGFIETMANHRDAFDGTRYGLNPTARIALGNETTLTAFYEYLDDDRVVDRGVPSIAVTGAPGRPLEGYDNTFFGSADRNRTTLQAHTFRVRVDHEYTDQLRGNITAQYADYDKAYQNIYAAGFDATVIPNRVTLDGYRDTTARTNLIVQGNLVGEFRTGSLEHTLLVGGEYGDQSGVRLNGFIETMANHRDAFDGTRYGLNPTARIALGNETTLTAFYEYLDDDRVVDRGVPSIAVTGAPGRPLEGYDNTFFGSADRNRTTLQAHTFRVRVDHEYTDQLRGNITAQYADYDKAYQNIYAAGFDATVIPNRVTLDGYRDTTARTNLIVQGNLVGEFRTGSLEHTLLVGGEYGDQDTTNARVDNLFAASNDDQISIDFSDPLVIPDFDFVTPVRDRSSSVQFTSLYIQDQIDLTSSLKVMIGARFDRFDVSVLDRQAVSATDNGRRGRVDEEVSPRFGLIYKPADNISFYASYSETFLPSAGDQFLTLSTTSEDIQPQTFENREIGAKWDINADLSFTAALFRLERGQFTTIDPDDPSIVTTVAGSTTEGFELQLVGELADGWTVNAGYSYLDGVVEGGGFDGNATRQTPEHMVSLWNRYQINGELAIAVGATYQDAYFVREDNGVELPGYTRFDAAVFYDLSQETRIQLNVENLFDTDYFPDAHSNSNISTGEPLNARLSISHEF